MWPKDYLNNLCAIYFIIIFLLIFFRVIGYAHKKIFQTNILEMTSLVNHHPVNIILSKDKVMLDSQYSQWHDTIHLQKKGSKGVFVNAIVI